MRLNLLSIKGENFMSIGSDPISMTFEPNVIVITGYNKDKQSRNGVGKTTILDMICFLFFGDTSRKILKNEIAHRHNNNTCIVVGDIEVNGDIYRIRRTVRPNKVTLTKLVEGEEADEDLTKTSIETNTDISELIGYNKELFMQEVVMTLKDATNIFQKSPTKKSFFIEQIFGLGDFDEHFKRAKKLVQDFTKKSDLSMAAISETKNSLDSFIESEKQATADKETAINKLKESLAESVSVVEKLVKNIDEEQQSFGGSIKDRLQALTEKQEEERTRLEEKRAQVYKHEKSVDELTHKLSEYDRELYTFTAQKEKLSKWKAKCDILNKTFEEIDIETLDDSFNTLTEKKNANLTKLNELKQLISNSEREELRCENEIEKLKTTLNNHANCDVKLCKECNKPLDDADIEKNKKIAEQQQKDLEKFQVTLKEINEKKNGQLENCAKGEALIEKLDAKLKEIGEQKSNYIKTQAERQQIEEIKVLEAEVVKSEEDVKKLNKKIEDTKINELPKAKELWDTTKQDVSKLVNSIADINVTLTQAKELEEKLATLQKTLEEEKFKQNLIEKSIQDKKDEENPFTRLVKEKKAQLQRNQSDYDDSWNKLQLYEKVKKVFSPDGVKTSLIEKSVGLFNEQLAYYLKKLNAPCICKFNSLFEETLEDEYGKEISYDSLSGGEAKRVDVALIFTFRDLRRGFSKRNLNFCFFDEIFDSAIDQQAMDAIIDILKNHVETYDESIFVVTHRQENTVIDGVKVIELIKENKVTKINAIV